MAIINDPLVKQYRAIALECVRSTKAVTLPNGNTMQMPDAHLIKKMMDFTWRHWISPMRPAFTKYFDEMMDASSEEYLHELQHQSSLSNVHEKAVTIFCKSMFPGFIERCMMDIDATVHNKYMTSAFLDCPPNSKVSLESIIENRYPKRGMPKNFFEAYKIRFNKVEPLKAIPFLLLDVDVTKKKQAELVLDASAFISRACASAINKKSQAILTAKILARQQSEDTQTAVARKSTTMM